MSITRKTRKLARSPGLFFRDMTKKRTNNLKHMPKNHKNIELGRYSYTVVSAVYNVDKYINKFINSLVTQSLSFENNIKLILVDDGSTDNSAAIIRNWKLKYPENIVYLKKTNGGQASARNLGLNHVNTDWVTFIDPDDFISKDYFSKVDEYLEERSSSKVQMVSCNFIPFHESTGKYIDNHPLKYRFKDGDKTIDLGKNGAFIQLSVSIAFFRTQIISENLLRFDERIKPSFEDAHFIACYLMATDYPIAGYLQTPKYYYRKRADNSSSLNTSWEKPSLFKEVLLHGCLDILERASHRYGNVPEYLQLTVLYHLIWYFKQIIDNDNSINHLDETDKEVFKNLLHRIFLYLDTKTIMRFNLGGAWFFHKVGLISLYHHKEPDFQIIYIDQVDWVKSEIKLRYFFHENDHEVIRLDGVDTQPLYAKTMKHNFLGDCFVSERILWIPILGEWQKLDVKIGNLETKLSFSEKHYNNGLPLKEVMKNKHRGNVCSIKPPLPARILRTLSKTRAARHRFLDSWLLMDRDIQADDNAEHLYRHLLHNEPEINAFFVLRRRSHDWNRLKKDGFRLVAFGSLNHKLALLNCKHLISSHADRYVTNYLEGKWYHDLTNFNYTFLQHGITKDDLSKWFNTKNICKLITATPHENESILSNHSNYKFTSKEVSLTGFPRHDALLERSIEKEKTIVIMPTWRLSIMGAGSGKTGKRKLSSTFFKSDYARFWLSLLHSEKLEDICRRHNYKIVFFPHANIQPYLKKTRLPNHIKTMFHKEVSVQKLLKQASLMITDYSSVAFDFAFLEKPIVYFQFDRNEIFSGGHTTSKGYFDYETDGFGDVEENLKGVLNSLEKSLVNNCEVEEKYLKRIHSTFPFRDGRCCERVVQAICDIDTATPPNVVNEQRVLEKSMEKSIRHCDWGLAEERLTRLIANSSKDSFFLQLVIVKRKLGKMDDALGLIEYLETDFSDVTVLNREKIIIAQCQNFLSSFENPVDVVDTLKNEGHTFNEINLDLSEALYKCELWEALDIACNLLSKQPNTDLGRLYFLWSMANKELGRDRLEIPNTKNHLPLERRAKTRPWMSPANSGETPVISEPTTPSVVVNISS